MLPVIAGMIGGHAHQVFSGLAEDDTFWIILTQTKHKQRLSASLCLPVLGTAKIIIIHCSHSLLSSIFPREIPPNTSILLDVVDVVFLIRILPSSNPLIGLIYPPSSAQSRQYNLSQSLQDTWSVHGTLPHSSHKNYHFSFCSCYYKPGILCACRPGLTGWPRPINIPGYLYPTSHLVWQQNRGAWSPPRTRLTIACITSLSPWVHIQNTTEVNGELVNRVVVDQPAATSIWPSIKEAITDYSLAGIVVHPCQLQTSIVFDVVDLYNMYSRIVICDIDW